MVAVTEKSNAVCKLIVVAAQALNATYTNTGNDPAFAGTVLPAGTITKLDRPNAAVKKITQPFATFGGRGAEQPGSKLFAFEYFKDLKKKKKRVY